MSKPVKVARAMNFREKLEELKKNPPPPISPAQYEEMQKILAELRKQGGFLELAFSDDIEKCANCGHEYTGKRLCPECGA